MDSGEALRRYLNGLGGEGRYFIVGISGMTDSIGGPTRTGFRVIFR
jgi:hypothetical protein